MLVSANVIHRTWLIIGKSVKRPTGYVCTFVKNAVETCWNVCSIKCVITRVEQFDLPIRSFSLSRLTENKILGWIATDSHARFYPLEDFATLKSHSRRIKLRHGVDQKLVEIGKVHIVLEKLCPRHGILSRNKSKVSLADNKDTKISEKLNFSNISLIKTSTRWERRVIGYMSRNFFLLHWLSSVCWDLCNTNYSLVCEGKKRQQQR